MYEIEFGVDLRIDGTKVGRFFGTIQEIRTIEELVVVTLDLDSYEESEWKRNLIAADAEGLVWRIGSAPPVQAGDCWEGTAVTDEGLWAIPEQGDQDYRIDLETGEIIESRKR